MHSLEGNAGLYSLPLHRGRLDLRRSFDLVGQSEENLFAHHIWLDFFHNTHMA